MVPNVTPHDTQRLNMMKTFILLLLLGGCLLAGSMSFTSAPTIASSLERDTGIGSSFKGPIGLQLYSLRTQFAKDVPGTMDTVQKFGIKYVELAGTYGLTAQKFKEQLDARGLKAI